MRNSHKPKIKLKKKFKLKKIYLNKIFSKILNNKTKFRVRNKFKMISNKIIRNMILKKIYKMMIKILKVKKKWS